MRRTTAVRKSPRACPASTPLSWRTTLDLTDFQLDEGGAIYEGDTVTMDDQHNLRKVK